MIEVSEPSISYSVQQGFKQDILDRISYIMSDVYIKHGFTYSNKTLNYTIAKQNNLFPSFWQQKSPRSSILHLCLAHLFPQQR